jgi:hypothetical protein
MNKPKLLHLVCYLHCYNRLCLRHLSSKMYCRKFCSNLKQLSLSWVTVKMFNIPLFSIFWLLSRGSARPQVVCRKLCFHIPLLVANVFKETPRVRWIRWKTSQLEFSATCRGSGTQDVLTCPQVQATSTMCASMILSICLVSCIFDTCCRQ